MVEEFDVHKLYFDWVIQFSRFDSTQDTNDCSSHLRLDNTNLLEVANTVSWSRDIELEGHVTFYPNIIGLRLHKKL